MRTPASPTASGPSGPATAGAEGSPKAPGRRARAAHATRDNILKAAIKVFAHGGFAGGRIGQISKAAGSHDRMIYYYFGSKEGLFIAVIEEIYRRFNAAEAALEPGLDLDRPTESLTAIVRFMWTYFNRHPEFITLLNSENLHRGRHISKSRRHGEYASPSLALLDQVLRQGTASGEFREGLRARDVYLLISSLGYFYLSNRHTLSAFLGERIDAPEPLARWEAFIIDAVMRVVAGRDQARE